MEKLNNERAKAREERLGRLRAATESRSEVLKKQKEEAERQSLERKNRYHHIHKFPLSYPIILRLIQLKEASVKRLRETTAVAEAIKLKDKVWVPSLNSAMFSFSPQFNRRVLPQKGRVRLRWRKRGSKFSRCVIFFSHAVENLTTPCRRANHQRQLQISLL